MKNSIFFSLLAVVMAFAACQNAPKKVEKSEPVSTRWTEEQAQQWATENGWLRGSNFNPSTAINQLEIWQAESFDTATINRELGWAAEIGMNAMRVYLHHLA